MASNLSEDNRQRLASIVEKMESNGESHEDIQLAVNHFKGKYGGAAPSRSGLKETASRYLRPALEIGGATVGGALASPLGPIATVGGGALGYGAGKSAADLADRLMGLSAPLAVKDIPKETIGNLYEGAKQEATGLGIGKLAVPAIKATASGAKTLGKGAISVVSPGTFDDVKYYFDKPGEVKNALTREQLGNTVVSSQKAVSDAIRNLDESAKGTLSQSNTVQKEQLISALNALKQKYVGSAGQAVSGEAKAAIAEIDNAIQGLSSINKLPDIPSSVVQEGEKIIPGILPTRTPIMKTIPAQTGRTDPALAERQIKDVMSQYKNINWDDPAGGAKKEIRKILDARLKSNPEYRKAMVPVAKLTKLQSVVDKKMALKYDPATGTYATDATAGKWTPRLLEGGKPELSSALKKLGDVTGVDILGKARATNIKEKFTGGKITGSRLVQLGRHLGGVPGATIGAALDKMGGSAAGTLIESLAKIPSFPSLPKKTQDSVVRALSAAIQNVTSRRENAKR